MNCFLGILVLAASMMTGGNATAQQAIKIGFVGTFSGSGAAFGEDMYDAFMLLVERNGGKLGGVPVQVTRKDMRGITFTRCSQRSA
jgi:branched-chain amino acid transport system substrate-binding protein